MSRSIKTNLYLFVKTILLGGTYTDLEGTVHTFEGLLDDNGKKKIKRFEPWNSELTNFQGKDSFPVPAVFFEFPTTDPEVDRRQLTTSETNYRPNYSDRATFALHLITTRGVTPGNVENDYLELLDLAAEISNALYFRSAPGIQNIFKTNETEDNDNEVLKDWIITFESVLLECGKTDLGDANDPEFNPNAPVNQVVGVTILKPPLNE